MASNFSLAILPALITGGQWSKCRKHSERKSFLKLEFYTQPIKSKGRVKTFVDM